VSTKTFAVGVKDQNTKPPSPSTSVVIDFLVILRILKALESRQCAKKKMPKNMTSNMKKRTLNLSIPALSRRSSHRPGKKRRFLNVSHSTDRTYDEKPEGSLQDGFFGSFEEKGREAWNSGRDVLDKFNHPLEDWAFFPKCLGSKKEVKKYGKQGKHYAAGYSQLGEMVQSQGSDYTKWPRLNLPNRENNEPAVDADPDDSDDATMSMSSSSYSSSSSGTFDGTHDNLGQRATSTVAAPAASSTGTTPPATVVVPGLAIIPPVRHYITAAGNRHLSTTAVSRSSGTRVKKEAEHPPAGGDAAAPTEASSRSAEDSTSSNNHAAVVTSSTAGCVSADTKIKEIELKQKEMQYKMDLFRNYREMRNDHGMTKQQIVKMFPDMVQYFSDDDN
jgi:hypothetical protein